MKNLGAELVRYPFIKIGALEKIPFSLTGNTKHWYDKGEDSTLSHEPPSACDGSVLPVWGIMHPGRHSGGCETSRSV